jgi:hypothetical protein
VHLPEKRESTLGAAYGDDGIELGSFGCLSGHVWQSMKNSSKRFLVTGGCGMHENAVFLLW